MLEKDVSRLQCPGSNDILHTITPPNDVSIVIYVDILW